MSEALGKHKYTDWIGFAAGIVMAGMAVVRAARSSTPVLIPVVILELVSAIAFLTRRPLRRQSSGVLPSVCAYVGSFGLLAFLFFANRFRPQWLVVSSRGPILIAALLLWLGATVAAIFVVWRLRHAFSVVPQARELVTDGPYRFARHPIYACYVAQRIGYLLAFWNVPVLIALAVWLVFMLLRIHYEEQVLMRAFPDYSAYRHEVGMFFPRLRRLPEPRTAAAAAGTAPPSRAA